MKRNQPPTGIGLGLREELYEDLMASDLGEIAFLEIHPENYVRRGGSHIAHLEAAAARWPILTHGLTTSFGNTRPFDPAYLAQLRDFLAQIGAPWHSDHLCFGEVEGVFLHELLPVPFNRDLEETAVARIREMRDATEVPIAIENISHYQLVGGSSPMDEVEVIGNILEKADAELLLDVNNIFVNAQNHGFSALAFLEQLPLERVVQIHVAGHDIDEHGMRVDTHAQPVPDEVYPLLEAALVRTGPVPVLLERDGNYPAFDELRGEVRRLSAVYDRAIVKHAARGAS